MSRNKKDSKIQMEVKPEVQLLDIRKALIIFNNERPEKALQLKDMEIIKLYASKYIPNMLASQEEWNVILEKF